MEEYINLVAAAAKRGDGKAIALPLLFPIALRAGAHFAAACWDAYPLSHSGSCYIGTAHILWRRTRGSALTGHWRHWWCHLLALSSGAP